METVWKEREKEVIAWEWAFCMKNAITLVVIISGGHFLLSQRFTSQVLWTLTRYPTIYNIICWFAGSLGQMTRRPSLWWSKYYFFFHNFLQNSFQKSFQFTFLFFYNFTKIRINSYETIMKKIMLGTSDAWSTSHLSQQTSILYCRLTDL